MPEKDMTAERPPEGSIEERQAERAIVMARAQRPGLYPISGGEGLLDATTPSISGRQELLLPQEEREKRERRAAYLSGFAERLVTTNDPQAMRRLVRELMSSIEKVVEMPDTQRIDAIRNTLAEKAIKFKDAQDPELARQTGLDKEGLIESVVTRQALRENPLGLFEIELSAEEALVLRAEDKGDYVSKDESGTDRLSLPRGHAWELQKIPQIKKILDKKETVTIPALYTQNELKKISETAEELRKEVLARTKIFIAYYLYRQAFFSLANLASLDARYSGIANEELRFLFSLGETKKGEMAFGDKIDVATRLYCLVAMANKKRRDKVDAKEDQARKELIRQSLRRQPPELSSRSDELVSKILELGSKNVFSQRVEGGNPAKEVTDWIKSVIGGSEHDTVPAVELARRFFFLFGLAAHFDYRQGKGPSGAANSDTTATIQHFGSWREDQAKKKYPHGPDVTLGKYPETLIGSFLHSTFIYEDREAKVTEGKTLWELWWDEGKRLRELPWGDLAEGAWFSYNFALSNLGKEKSVYDMMMEPALGDLLKAKSLQILKRSIDRGIQAVSILGPDKKRWPEMVKKEIEELGKDGYEVNIPKDKDPKALSLKELNDELLSARRRQILETILIGAITESYRDDPDGTVRVIGFLHVGSETPQIRTRKSVFLSLVSRVGCDPDSILERSKQFLEGLGYSTGAI